MIRLLRRVAPRNPFLAALFWLGLLVGALALLWFVVFPWVDGFLPGSGMF